MRDLHFYFAINSVTILVRFYGSTHLATYITHDRAIARSTCSYELNLILIYGRSITGTNTKSTLQLYSCTAIATGVLSPVLGQWIHFTGLVVRPCTRVDLCSTPTMHRGLVREHNAQC